MEKITQSDNDNLFTSNALSYFKKHGAKPLLMGRNAHLGSLITSERAVYYLNLLYRMLLFKRDYELEPLYDDIYRGVVFLCPPVINKGRGQGIVYIDLPVDRP